MDDYYLLVLLDPTLFFSHWQSPTRDIPPIPPDQISKDQKGEKGQKSSRFSHALVLEDPGNPHYLHPAPQIHLAPIKCSHHACDKKRQFCMCIRMRIVHGSKNGKKVD